MKLSIALAMVPGIALAQPLTAEPPRIETRVRIVEDDVLVGAPTIVAVAGEDAQASVAGPRGYTLRVNTSEIPDQPDDLRVSLEVELKRGMDVRRASTVLRVAKGSPASIRLAGAKRPDSTRGDIEIEVVATPVADPSANGAARN